MTTPARLAGLGLMLLAACLIAGCLEKPKIEDRWTRVDVLRSNMTPGQIVAQNSTQAITMNTTITYRSVLTGFAVAELRACDSLAAAALTVAPDAPRVTMARNIDLILQHSVSCGRATRAVTGWDHLIQPIDFSFGATTPSGTGSAGAQRLFLLCYLGSGVRVEQPGGADSIVVTPFISSDREVLPVGMELSVSGTP